MQAELKQKWLDALRSDRYEQGKGELCMSYESGRVEHCCLGVLAEALGVERSNLFNAAHLDHVGRTDVLGPWGEGAFSRLYPDTLTTVQRKLAAMNDGGKSFAEIADWIEANIPADAA